MCRSTFKFPLQEVCQTWLKEIQQQIRCLEYQPSIQDKKAVVEQLRGMLKDSEARKSDFDELHKQAHAVAQKSNETHVSTAASQLTNRYNVLGHHISEKLHQWETLVQDHDAFDKILSETHLWMADFESKRQNCTKPKDQEDKTRAEANLEQLQQLLAQREEGFRKLETLNASVGKVLPNTSSEGREQLRHKCQEVQNSWDTIMTHLNRSKGQLEGALAQWNLYDEEAEQLERWLKQQQSSLDAEASSLPITLADKKARLERVHQLMAHVAAHQETVRSLSDKVRGFKETGSGISGGGQEAMQKVFDVIKKFDQLQKSSQEIAQTCENAVKDHQLYRDALNVSTAQTIQTVRL